jgi:hypothetical protein
VSSQSGERRVWVIERRWPLDLVQVVLLAAAIAAAYKDKPVYVVLVIVACVIALEPVKRLPVMPR